MKAIKILGIALLTFMFTGNIVAQNNGSNYTGAANDQDYFTNTQTLKTYFTNLEIPANFPKYNKVLGEEGNAKAAANWAQKSGNYELLSTAGIKALEDYKKEQAVKTGTAPKK